jgi:HlyD family secretion protein
LRLSQANLDYTTIRSPVSGVVIARNVNEGQTVVASMSAQVLFLIANDLKQMQVESSIPESEIGKIQIGQSVEFTVDAYDRSFRGSVSQIRLAAATVQNVVTYPVVVSTENADLKLFPSMTANITCEVAYRGDALKVPNAALRFKPEEAAVGKGSSDKGPGEKGAAEKGAGDKAGADRGSPGKAPPGPPGGEKAAVEKAGDVKASGDMPAAGERGRGRRSGDGERGGGGRSGWSRSAGKVWVQKTPGAPLEPIVFSLGISDGSFTEVLESTELKEGQEVITGYTVPGSKQAEVVNPFAPPSPPGMRRAGR